MFEVQFLISNVTLTLGSWANTACSCSILQPLGTSCPWSGATFAPRIGPTTIFSLSTSTHYQRRLWSALGADGRPSCRCSCIGWVNKRETLGTPEYSSTSGSVKKRRFDSNDHNVYCWLRDRHGDLVIASTHCVWVETIVKKTDDTNSLRHLLWSFVSFISMHVISIILLLKGPSQNS